MFFSHSFYIATILLASLVATENAICVAAGPFVPTKAAASTSDTTSQWMVTTHVFQGDQNEPSETHTIVFQDGVYYDFPSDPNQSWTMFDLPRSRIVLFDRTRQRQTSVLTEDLIHLSARAEAEVTDPVMRQRFGMDAVAQQKGEMRFVLAYADTQYEVFGEHCPDTAMAVQYGRFVDWVCRLNIARPRGVPPFARIKLNSLMTGQNVLPRETHVTMTRHVGAERIPATIRLRSTTAIGSEITPAIAAKIKDAQTMGVVYPAVPWDEFEP